MKEHEAILPRIRKLASPANAEDFLDDVARLGGGDGLIVTVDALVQGRHFLPSDPLETVGAKLVHVNVSDVLSKGAVPNEALLTLGWPEDRSAADLDTFLDGFKGALDAWEVRLIGGDTVTVSGGTFLSLTLTGKCIGAGPIRRSGGRAGDALFVTGEIGAGYLGLQAALVGEAGSDHLDHYRVPRLPPAAIASIIAAMASASMDVSDGLLGDAWQLARASGCGLDIDLASISYAGPADTPADRLAQATGGDDYQCLFAVPVDRVGDLKSATRGDGIRITHVGALTDSCVFRLSDGGVRQPLPERMAFEHGA